MFVAYSSIENSYRDKFVSSIREAGLDKVEWVALEKVHGCNFGFWPIDGVVRPSQRTQFTDGSFYGCAQVVEELTPRVLSLGKIVYGELFGQGIQKGINYGKKRFAAFDIWHNGFLNYDDFVTLCDKFDIARCAEIARGSFDDLLSIDPAFPTKMSDCGATDIAEGFVMKPVVEAFTEFGRAILKKKSAKFLEKAVKEKSNKPTLSDEQNEVLSVCLSYLCPNRVSSAVSKHGEKFPIILKEVIADILKEVTIDGVEVDKLVMNELNSATAKYIRAELFPNQ
jgi:Rnl2 family RNA ligase